MMSDRIYSLLSDTTCDQPRPLHAEAQQQAREQETVELRREELTVGYRLNVKQSAQREKVVASLVESGKRYLYLRDATVELAIRLFDLYCLRVMEGAFFDGKRVGHCEKGRCVVQRRDEAQLAAVAALFCCCKYNEIYPPALSDIVFVFGDKFSRNDIIRKELELLHITGFGFEISSISKWYQHYYSTPLPSWTLDCYLKCFGRMEDVARVVQELAGEGEVSTIASRVCIAQKVVSLLNSREDQCRNDKFSK